MLNGIKLSFPNNGPVFRASSNNIGVNYTHQAQFLFDVGGNISAILESFVDLGGQDNRADSPMQDLKIGAGAGIRAVDLVFTGWEGDTDEWGDANASDGPLTKLQTLEYELAQHNIDSNNPLTFEHAEYSSSGKYAPLSVVYSEANLGFESEEQVSTFTNQITLVESTDLTAAIDAVQRNP